MKNTFQKFIKSPEALRYAMSGNQHAVAAALVANQQRAISISSRQDSAFTRALLFNQPRRMFAVTKQQVPGLGDSISEGVIQEFVKQPGEFVEADEIIARIETDKVTVDILA